MIHAPLLSPLALGELRLTNRIVMAPMTRNRALLGDVAGPLTVEYYAARAGAGLIITEGTWPLPDGKGYARTPGIGSAAQGQAWRQVTEAVHGAGGRIVMQLMHCGRIGSHLNKSPGTRTLAPSAIQAAGRIFTDVAGLVDFDVPEALTLREVAATIEGFAAAARAARAAGFDGVELHAASGYLPMQFLSTGTNRRTDAYGGSLTGRLRFVMETIAALVSACGAGRVGIRICPGNTFNDLHDADPRATYGALLQALSPVGLAYLHVVRSPDPALDAFGLAAAHYRGARILNDGFDFESGNAAVRDGAADAISYARAFIANPDFVERCREGWPLAGFDRRTLYTPGPEGYTSYPPYRAAP